MSEELHIADLLKEFAKSPSRRSVLRSLVAAGASLATLTSFAEELAAAEGDDVSKLTIFSWSGLMPGLLETYSTRPFQKDYPKSSIQLEVSTNTIIYPKMIAGRARPTISGGMFNETFTYRGINDKLWTKLDDANMPNKKTVEKNLVLNDSLAIGFLQSPFGIAYNPDRVEKPKSWLDLFNPKYKGRVALWDGYFPQFIGAAVASGQGPTVEAGIKAWQAHKANIGAWEVSNSKGEDDVSRGDMWFFPNFGAWTEQARKQGKNIAFALPKEGGVFWGGYMVSVNGFSKEVTKLTQHYLDTWNSEACQLAMIRNGFFVPTKTNLAIPDDLKGMDALMTANEAAKKLIQYDIKGVGENVPKLKAMSDELLKV